MAFIKTGKPAGKIVVIEGKQFIQRVKEDGTIELLDMDLNEVESPKEASKIPSTFEGVKEYCKPGVYIANLKDLKDK